MLENFKKIGTETSDIIVEISLEMNKIMFQLEIVNL